MPASLQELFSQYLRENTDSARLAAYRAVCSHIEDIRNGRQQLTPEFVKLAWTAKDFGPSNVNNGVLGDAEFERCREELTELTEKIIADPSPAMLDRALTRFSALKEHGLIQWRPVTITNRLLAACAPPVYTCAVYSDFYIALYRLLRSAYNVAIKPGNWAVMDSSMRSVLVARHGLNAADPYQLNVFLGTLAKQTCMERKGRQGKTPRTEQDTEDEERPEDRSPAGTPLSVPFPPALNTIFYGPPGTGKTREVLHILREHFTDHQERETEAQRLERLVHPVVWRDVICAALHELGDSATVPRLRGHPLVDAKYRCTDGNLTHARLWSNLQTHSPTDSRTVHLDLARKRPPVLFDKLNDGASTWTLLPGWEDEAPGALELIDRFRQEPPASGHEEKRYACVTFHQSYSYEEFVEGIRPVFADEDAEEDAEYALRDGLFKRMCAQAREHPDRTYALLIDEINRGNISKIFGELISLVEDSKREGAPDAMTVRLPCSGEDFSVPGNLYLLGTMNTADRSLALMDTALRRRFSFERVDPDPSVLEGMFIEGISLERLLRVLNERIEVLYDKEHAIGHAYFLGLRGLGDLAEVFSKKIIPLLEEYFFDDWEKIRLVLGDNQKTQGMDELCLLVEEDCGVRLFGEEAGGTLPPRRSLNRDALLNARAYIAIYDPAEAGQ